MPFTEHHMQKAVERGQTAVCEYLQSQQCPLAHSMYHSAARNGHADTLHWLRQQEHYFNVDNDNVCEFAALGGSVAVLEYLLREGLLATRLTWVRLQYELALSTQSTLSTTALCANGQLAAAQWLRQQGAEWPAVLLDYERKWSGKTLAWARAEGCDSPTEHPPA
eukprot:15199-Heterococcus_DN1.PRE.1